ncbi:MAG: DUF3037 domain-containing protein [Bacteroidota bacterium]
MNPYFEYSVLKYRPSYLLDERVNIGLLFRFETAAQQDRFVFSYPSRLRRISQFFPSLGNDNLNHIRAYLRTFTQIANEIDDKESSDFKQIISDAFIVDDANSFFFSDIKKGFYDSIEETKTYYEQLYFKFYDLSPSKKTKDAIVKAYFERSLRQLVSEDDVRLTYFEPSIHIENKIAASKFEYRWQNGSTNLIKTLGLELADKQDIQDKAFKWVVAINYIHQIEQYQDYQFDLLIGRPKSPSLFKAYDNALAIFEDLKVPKRIIEEEGIGQYAQEALETVKSPTVSSFEVKK